MRNKEWEWGRGSTGTSSHPAQLAIFVSSSVYIKFSATPRNVVFIKCNKMYFIYILYFFFVFFANYCSPSAFWIEILLNCWKNKNPKRVAIFRTPVSDIYETQKHIRAGRGGRRGSRRSKSLKSASNHFALHIFTVTWAYLLSGRRPSPLSPHSPSRLFLLFSTECGGGGENISGISTVAALT